VIKPEVIRLFGIDCPEKDQDFEPVASSLIKRWCLGKTVEVFPIGETSYCLPLASFL
jgi:endonuclease YncB( thermonuclease family)